MNKKKILIIGIVVILVIILVVGSLMIINHNNTKNDTTNDDTSSVEYEGLTESEVEQIVKSKVNSGSIYIDDVDNVISVSNITFKETIDNIEFWQMNIKYEKSSLSAPMGQSYAGKTFNGSYCFAYNKETKKSFKYMFEVSEYTTLKGWSTQGHKEDSSYWRD